MTTDYALSLRPKSLDEMCGQKTIVAEMKKRSLTMEFPSVMIFGGFVVVVFGGITVYGNVQENYIPKLADIDSTRVISA